MHLRRRAATPAPPRRRDGPGRRSRRASRPIPTPEERGASGASGRGACPGHPSGWDRGSGRARVRVRFWLDDGPARQVRGLRHGPRPRSARGRATAGSLGPSRRGLRTVAKAGRGDARVGAGGGAGRGPGGGGAFPPTPPVTARGVLSCAPDASSLSGAGGERVGAEAVRLVTARGGPCGRRLTAAGRASPARHALPPPPRPPSLALEPERLPYLLMLVLDTPQLLLKVLVKRRLDLHDRLDLPPRAGGRQPLLDAFGPVTAGAPPARPPASPEVQRRPP